MCEAGKRVRRERGYFSLTTKMMTGGKKYSISFSFLFIRHRSKGFPPFSSSPSPSSLDRTVMAVYEYLLAFLPPNKRTSEGKGENKTRVTNTEIPDGHEEKRRTCQEKRRRWEETRGTTTRRRKEGEGDQYSLPDDTWCLRSDHSDHRE